MLVCSGLLAALVTMKASEVIAAIQKIEEDLPYAQDYPDFYSQLLDDYATHVWALKYAGNTWPMEHAIELSERLDEIIAEDMPASEIDECVRLYDMLDIIWTEVPKGGW